AGSYEVFTVSSDGTNVTQVTHEPPEYYDYYGKIAWKSDVAWSRDGSEIAYCRMAEDRQTFTDLDERLWGTSPDGTVQRPLTDNGVRSQDAWRDFQPAWSPDGSDLV